MAWPWKLSCTSKMRKHVLIYQQGAESNYNVEEITISILCVCWWWAAQHTWHMQNCAIARVVACSLFRLHIIILNTRWVRVRVEFPHLLSAAKQLIRFDFSRLILFTMHQQHWQYECTKLCYIDLLESVVITGFCCQFFLLHFYLQNIIFDHPPNIFICCD